MTMQKYLYIMQNMPLSVLSSILTTYALNVENCCGPDELVANIMMLFGETLDAGLMNRYRCRCYTIYAEHLQ